MSSRQIYINPCCFLERKEWLVESWRVLGLVAQYDRDYSLPAPSTNCYGCLPSELRYDTAFAMRNRVLYSLRKEGTPVFTRVSTSFWTPHSARAFMPSSTKALGVPKEERNDLGGWSAHGSDTCTRVAVRVISNLQRLLIRALIEQTNADPLAEEETFTQCESFLCEKGVALADRLGCLKQVGMISVTSTAVRDPNLAVDEVGPIPAQDMIPDEEPTVESVPEVPRTDKRFKSESSRTQVLGDNPLEVREHARRSLEPGYYLSASGRNATRILHCSEDCYMVPGIDYVRHQLTGRLLPSISEFDVVRKLCSKKSSVRIHESSGTETSSSTS